MAGPIQATLTLEGIPMAVEGRRYRLPEGADPGDLLDLGVDLCRGGRWDDGIDLLGRLREPDFRSFTPTGRHLSYLGHGLARQGKTAEGIRLCRLAVDRPDARAESYLNLTRTLLLAGRRGAAWWSLARGLSADPAHPELLALRREMGERRPPVIPFLSRQNLLNRLLGYLRYRLSLARTGNL